MVFAKVSVNGRFASPAGSPEQRRRIQAFALRKHHRPPRWVGQYR
jgi:hypothetical protein